MRFYDFGARLAAKWRRFAPNVVRKPLENVVLRARRASGCRMPTFRARKSSQISTRTGFQTHGVPGTCPGRAGDVAGTRRRCAEDAPNACRRRARDVSNTYRPKSLTAYRPSLTPTDQRNDPTTHRRPNPLILKPWPGGMREAIESGHPTGAVLKWLSYKD